MKVRDILGRRVVGVRQTMINTPQGRTNVVDSIQLEGGIALTFTTIELEGDYAHHVQVVKHAHSKTLPLNNRCPKCMRHLAPDFVSSVCPAMHPE